MNYHWLSFKSRGTLSAIDAEQTNATQAVNGGDSNKKYPKESQLLKQYKMEQQQADKIKSEFRNHLQQRKRVMNG